MFNKLLIRFYYKLNNKTYKYKTNMEMIEQPKNMRIELYPHQLASINKMEYLECCGKIGTRTYIKETKIGFNAQITGYGKSLEMIGLILQDKREWDLDKSYINENITTQAGGLIRVKTQILYDKLPTTLILVNNSIIKQWEYEINRACDLKVVLVTSKRLAIDTNPEEYDIVLGYDRFGGKWIGLLAELMIMHGRDLFLMSQDMYEYLK